jgi:hypothetical protein
MNCYTCERSAQATALTLRYAIAPAVGTCRDCGIGICLQHSRKADEGGAPLLCLSCAEQRRTSATMPHVPLGQPQRTTR